MVSELTSEDEMNLKDHVRGLYTNLRDALREATRESDGIAFVCIDPHDVLILESAFRLLVERNRESCNKTPLLDAGCKVELALNAALPHLQTVSDDPLEIQFDVWWIFCASFMALFSLEAQAGAITVHREDNLNMEELRGFFTQVPYDKIVSVRKMQMSDMIYARFSLTH
ncbi:MAG: hypothetical protein BMS9Abin13_493 [Patescibacteria group bacterium]|nr:MAG: hypothetical protein BMS9Abin13_493 [Patescibacteria group bacterium]